MGDGNGGEIVVVKPGQEILARSSVQIDKKKYHCEI